METPIFAFELEEIIPVTLLERMTLRPTPVPTLYAIRCFCRELEAALDRLLQSPDLQMLLSEREEEKNEVYERLQRIMFRFQEFLMINARR